MPPPPPPPRAKASPKAELFDTLQPETVIVSKLVPSGKKSDTTWFLGFGGGVDALLSKHLAVRTQVDVVYDHLFNDLLRDGRWTIRFSVGPAFNFGKNIEH